MSGAGSAGGGGEDGEHRLLEAVAFAAETLLRGGLHLPLPEVLEVLGVAAGVARVALIAARFDQGTAMPRMEVRHQWSAPGVSRLLPGRDGWYRYAPGWVDALEHDQLVLGSTSSFPAAERAIFEVEGAHSVALAPVRVGDRWYGHLSFGDIRTDRVWTPRETEALRAAAGIVGAAIQHRRTVAALERRTAVLEAVGEAAPLLLEADSWRAVLPRVLELLRSATRSRSAWAYGPDPGRPAEGGVLLAEVLAPGARPATSRGLRLSLTPDAVARLGAGEVIQDELVVGDAEGVRTSLEELGVVSWLVVPVIMEPGAIGGLGLDSERPRTWSEGEIQALRVAAGALGAAIRRDRAAGEPPPTVPDPWGPGPPRR